ncbi:hypothetical protein BV140_887 [Haemophilus influenzae]|nr:hypothetical protein BV083_829 [Haemophilus influenzae]AVI97649.1 hypothetical protein BV085_827 [Haemophilus influenzae]AVJ06668.1 hypothetical protein BV139_886 [Haemophilus influenzae]AVJ08501.1 hypothetical protein BV140_887 [Haemophilus influenzae]AVJ10227.1 hypothetical protein BVZ63_778 [Haemophilus influenzae]
MMICQCPKSNFKHLKATRKKEKCDQFDRTLLFDICLSCFP